MITDVDAVPPVADAGGVMVLVLVADVDVFAAGVGAAGAVVVVGTAVVADEGTAVVSQPAPRRTSVAAVARRSDG